jgi:hypothetical protein
LSPTQHTIHTQTHPGVWHVATRRYWALAPSPDLAESSEIWHISAQLL